MNERRSVEPEDINNSVYKSADLMRNIEAQQKKRKFKNWFKRTFRRLLGMKSNEPKRIDKRELPFGGL